MGGGRATAMAILVALAAVGCDRSAPISGRGTLRQLSVTGPRGVNDSVATANGRFLAFSTTGPSAMLLATDARFSSTTRGGYPPDGMAPSDAEADEMLVSTWHAFEILCLPKLRQKERIEISPDIVSDVLKWQKFRWLSLTSTGWAATTSGGSRQDVVVAEILSNPLRLGRLGKAETREAAGVAVDRSSGKLVICGDRVLVEVYDLARMKSLARCSLDLPVGYSVCAGDGAAWIATTEGSILRFDIASATVAGRTVVADPQGKRLYMRLDLGASGRYLAASVSTPVAGRDFATTLKVFLINGQALEEVATARAHLSHAINDLTLLEGTETVLICTPLPVFAWHYGS